MSMVIVVMVVLVLVMMVLVGVLMLLLLRLLLLRWLLLLHHSFLHLPDLHGLVGSHVLLHLGALMDGDVFLGRLRIDHFNFEFYYYFNPA